MKILALLISDESSMNEETGKLSIIGIFDGISTKGFPAVHPGLMVTVIIEGTAAEGGKRHPLSIRVEKNGEEIQSFDGDIEMGARHHQIVKFENILFKSEGTYTITATINDDSLSTNLLLKLLEEENHQSS